VRRLQTEPAFQISVPGEHTHPAEFTVDDRDPVPDPTQGADPGEPTVLSPTDSSLEPTRRRVEPNLPGCSQLTATTARIDNAETNRKQRKSRGCTGIAGARRWL